jgi:GT2 family glycosyltransferase
VREIFDLEKDAIGITGVMEDEKERRPKNLHRIFLLNSKKPGKILKSGQTTMPFSHGEVSETEWLPGGAMSYRSRVFSNISFDASIRMYGEDIEFSLRAIRIGKLLVSRKLTYNHLGATLGKDDVQKVVQYSAAIRYWLARKYPREISKAAVIWSIIGITIVNILNITVMRNVKYNLNCILGHLAFLNMIILKKDLKQNF